MVWHFADLYDNARRTPRGVRGLKYGGMALRKESIEYMNVNKTREEDKAAAEELIKEWTSNG